MRYEQLTKPPRLFEWMATHLPASLRAKPDVWGYGTICGIFAKVRGITHLFDDPVALIDDDSVTLYSPEYFADFEALCQQYEGETGYTITLRVWQSPKDAK